MKIRRTLAVLALVSTTLSMPASADVTQMLQGVGVGFQEGMSHLLNSSYSVGNVNSVANFLQHNPIGFAVCGTRSFTNWVASQMNVATQITCSQMHNSFLTGYVLAPVTVAIGCGIAAYVTYKVTAMTCRGIASSYRYLANR